MDEARYKLVCKRKGGERELRSFPNEASAWISFCHERTRALIRVELWHYPLTGAPCMLAVFDREGVPA